MLGLITRGAAQRFGMTPAYISPAGWPLSYQELDQISDEVASGLSARGLKLGDVVSLLLPPGLEYLVSYVGAAKIGAITAGVNYRLTANEQLAILNNADPKLVITTVGGDSFGFPAVELTEADSLNNLSAEIREPDSAPEILSSDPNRPVAIIFTSGTTGTPKGALYCNRQLEFITQTDVGDNWGGGTLSFTGTSFAHLGFMTKLPGNLKRGGTSFIMKTWSAKSALDLIAREKMVTIAGVPAQIALMLRHPDFDQYDLTSVQNIIVGGGPVTPGLAENARKMFGARLATRYSCTEAGIGLGTSFDDPEEDAILSVGHPLAAVSLRVIDESLNDVESGETGEIALRSHAVMSEYWRDPKATAAMFTPDGFIRTGDLGWIDEQGRVRLVGRSKEMYVRGGYNVYPVEVEAVLSTHPDIANVVVIPQSDPVMGEVGVAFVTPRAGRPVVTLADLHRHAGEQLARYKLPAAILKIDDLPLTAGEKTDRAALAAILSATPAPLDPEFTPDANVR